MKKLRAAPPTRTARKQGGGSARLLLERTPGQWECGQSTDSDPAASGEPQDEAQGEYWQRPLARESVAVESTGYEDLVSELEHFVNPPCASHD